MRKETQNFINNIMSANTTDGLNLRAIETQGGDLVVFKNIGERNARAVLVTSNKRSNVSISNVVFYHSDIMKDFK